MVSAYPKRFKLNCIFSARSRSSSSTPAAKLDDHLSSSRPSEPWHLRHAVSIDNISFISCATSADEHGSTNKDNISVVEHSSNNHFHNNNNNNNYNGNMSKNSSMEHLDRCGDARSPPATSSVGAGRGVVTTSDEQENIIPWRAQLRKTNSRLSLVG